MTFVNCFSKSINPISRLPIPRRVPPGALLAAELCDNWQLIAQVSPSRRSLASRDIPRTAAGAIFVVIVKIDACFLSVPHFCAGARVSRFVSFCFGTVRCGSVLSSVASRAALCSIGAMIDGENVTVTGYMRLPTWPEEPQLVWVLECAKRCLSLLCAACCIVYGAVVSVPDVEPWGCWRLTVSLIGRFLLYAAFWQMTNHNERLSYTFNWHLPSLPLTLFDSSQPQNCSALRWGRQLLPGGTSDVDGRA